MAWLICYLGVWPYSRASIFIATVSVIVRVGAEMSMAGLCGSLLSSNTFFY